MPLPTNPHPDRHRMLGYPPCDETLRLLGITKDEWQFIQGRYEQARKELRNLRTGIKRVAESTKDAEIMSLIPAGDETCYDERGWNYLCGALVEHIERLKRRYDTLTAD